MSCPGTRLLTPTLCAFNEPCSDRRTCEGCGSTFCVAPSRPHRFCSDTCRRAAGSGQGNPNYRTYAGQPRVDGKPIRKVAA